MKHGERQKQFNFCKTCGIKFYNTYKSLGAPDFKKRKYCSVSCGSKDNGYQKGHASSYNKTGPAHINWKGDKIGYWGVHKWAMRHWGQPNTCEYCKKTGLSGRQIHWANISHEYKRERSDWVRLCQSCHSYYDRGKLELYLTA